VVNVGTAVGYLDLDYSKFTKGFKGASNDLKVFQQENATAADKFTALGSAMTKIGSTLTKTVTLPIVAVGTVAVTSAADFEKSMKNIQSITGATGEEMLYLEQKAKEMGQTTVFSASDAADAFKYMAIAGQGPERMLESLDGIANLAAASNMNLGRAAEIVADSLEAFGLKASDAGAFADVLAATTNVANVEVDQLGETLKYFAPVASALGYTIEDAAVAMALMANQGIKAGQAGTSLRMAFLRMVNPPKQAAEAMEEYGINLKKQDGTMMSMMEVIQHLRERFATMTEEQQVQAAASIFGANAMSGMLAVVRSTDEQMSDVVDVISDASNAYDGLGMAAGMAATQNESFSNQATILKNNLNVAAIELGTVLLPMLKDLIQWLMGVVNAFVALDDGTKRTIVTIAGIAAAVGPVLLVIGSVFKAIGSLISIFGMLKTVVMGLFTLIAAHPVMALIIAVAALGIALVGMARDTSAADESIKNIKNSITDFGDMVKGTEPKIADMSRMLSSQGNSFADLERTIREKETAITEILSTALQEGRELRQSELADIARYTQELAELYRQRMEIIRAQMMAENTKLQLELTTIDQEGAAQRLANAQEYYNQAQAEAENAYTAELTLIEQKYQAMGEVGSAAYQAELAQAQEHYQTSLSENQAYLNTTYELVSQAAGTWVSEDAQKWASLSAQADVWQSGEGKRQQGMLERFGNWVSGYSGQANNFAAVLEGMDINSANSFLSMLATTKQKGGEITEESKTLAANMLNAFVGLPGQMNDKGKEILLGMIGGLASEIPGLEDTSKMSADQIVATLQKELGIQSPSRVTFEIGSQVGEGAIKGLLSQQQSIERQAKGFGSGLIGSLQAGMESVWGTLTSWVNSALDWISKQFNAIGSFVSGIAAGGKKSHAAGLDFVPYDNYAAMLHQGERVLTAQEAQAYERGEGGGKKGNTYNFYSPKAIDVVEAKRMFDTAEKASALGFNLG